ncbi:Uncharacterized protein Adt_33320 [Abeliophyllum distichum]|uniref:Putative plant transposon protein domain-containing protein n=1 Tax=Abeliophyllum distichum TaxID=126358 RepID=A0ABD1QZI3_9LAMI
MEDFPTLWFKDAASFSRYHVFKDCKLTRRRYINMEFLESLQFPYLATFKEFKWIKFLEIDGRYCDKIVRCFYSNTKMLDDGSRAFDRIPTYVKEKSLMINAGLLSKIHGVPLPGEAFGDKFNVLEACRVVYEDPELTSPRFDVAGFRRDIRLLHLIVVHFFKPRSGRLPRLSCEDIWMIWKIVEGHRFNICDLIIYSISKFIFHLDSRTMTFGCLIIDLMHRLGVDFSNEVLVSLHPNRKIG